METTTTTTTPPKPKSNTSSRRTNLFLRLLGLIIALVGGLILWRGGKDIHVELFGNALINLPLEYVLIIVGLLLFSLPLLFVYTLALILPERYEKRLLDYADSLDPENQQLKDSPSPEKVSALLHNHIHRTNKRAYTLILVAVIFIFIVLPLLMKNYVSHSQFKRESERLTSLIQETRLDYASSDHIREHLHEIEGSLPLKSSATRDTFITLRELYDPSIKDPAAFARAINAAYETRIKPHVTETGVLRTESFNVENKSSEAELASVTYLTLLATICNVVGDHGTHVDPYIQGRQLLKLASARVTDKDKVPVTHNTSGVNYAGLLKTYPGFAEKFANPMLAQEMRSALGMNTAPTQLWLLRQATAEYTLAEEQSATNLAKARSKNNRIDVLLTFLYELHVEKHFDAKIVRDETDREFLENEFALSLSSQSIDQQKLIQILNHHRDELAAAAKLSQEPEIYFTIAQLHSVGGQLGEMYHLSDGYWGNADITSNTAITNLRTAESLQLPKRLFERAVAKQLLLEWLWNRPNLAPQLEQLSRS